MAPLPGARRLLEQLARRGSPAVLTSSAQDDEFEPYMSLLEARDLVAGWTTASDVSRSKPEPTALALRRSGRDRGVVIGDSPWDCRAAEAAGLPSAAVLTGGFAAREPASTGAATICENLDELCDDLDAVLDRERRHADLGVGV